MTTFEWLHCSDVCVGLNDVEQAKSCVELAEAAATMERHDIGACESCWEALGEPMHSGRCKSLYSRRYKDYLDQFYVSRSWHYHWNRHDFHSVVVPEKDAGSWWTALAQAWDGIAETAETRRCIQHAEPIGTCEDLLGCARLWFLMGEPEAADRVAHLAEGRVMSALDWESCASFWGAIEQGAASELCYRRYNEMGLVENENLEGVEAVASVLQAAEYACFRRQDHVEARSYIRKTESLIEDLDPDAAQPILLRLVKLWLAIADEHAGRNAVETYLAGPEGLEGSELCFRARLCLFIGKTERSREYVRRAEEMPETSILSSHCARIRHALDDVAGAAGAMQRAEATAVGFKDWAYCADSWREIGAADKAQRCLTKAESLADGGSDLGDCASIWHALGMGSEACRVLQQADARAERAGDWLDNAYI